MRMQIPREVIIHANAVAHPTANEILVRCRDAKVTLYDGQHTHEAVTKASAFYDESMTPRQKRSLGKRILYLYASEVVAQLRSEAMHCAELRCPGAATLRICQGTCPFSCEYCWRHGSDYTVAMVNVAFFDHLDVLDCAIKAETADGRSAVFTHQGGSVDSLESDGLLRVNERLVRLFAERPNAYLHLQTKSDKVDGLLGLQHNGHTLMNWTMNASIFSELYEHGTAGLAQRIEAARRCEKAGYPILFRFDPLYLIDEWERHYRDMIERIFAQLRPLHITIGLARYGSQAVIDKIIENTKGMSNGLLLKHRRRLVDFPDCPTQGVRLRYPDEDRYRIYSFVVDEIRHRAPNVSVAVCLEPPEMWDRLGLRFTGNRNKDCMCSFCET